MFIPVILEYLEDSGNLKCHGEHVDSLMEGKIILKKELKPLPVVNILEPSPEESVPI